MFKISKATLKRYLTAQNNEHRFSLELHDADFNKAQDIIFNEIEKLAKGIIPDIYVEETGIGPYDYGSEHGIDKGKTYLVCEGNTNGKFILTVDVTKVSDPDNKLEENIKEYCKNIRQKEERDTKAGLMEIYVEMVPEIKRIEQDSRKLLQINLVWKGIE